MFVNPFQNNGKAFFPKSILLCFPACLLKVVGQRQTIFKSLVGNAFQSLAGPEGNKSLVECTLGCIPLCAGTGAAFLVSQSIFCLPLYQLTDLTALFLPF